MNIAFLHGDGEKGPSTSATETGETDGEGIAGSRGEENDSFGVIREEGSSLDSSFSTIGVFFSGKIEGSTSESLNSVLTVAERSIVGGVLTTPPARRADGEVDPGRNMLNALGLSGGESFGVFRIHGVGFAGSEGGEN
jgi:hypothetical protein